MKKYMTATAVNISKGRKVDEDSSVALRVISGTERTDASDEYLINMTKFDASGGRLDQNACGKMILEKVCSLLRPRTFAAST